MNFRMMIVLLRFVVIVLIPSLGSGFIPRLIKSPLSRCFSSFYWKQTLLASIPSVDETENKISFEFIPYGSSIDNSHNENEFYYITCDGKVPGNVDLELTHWTDNATPNEYYADTSTEIALNYHYSLHDDAKKNGRFQDIAKKIKVINNHYDTDGVLSIWTCLQQTTDINEAHTIVRKYHQLLIDGAEAGDFGEWSSDAGVKLDCALDEILNQADDDEEKAYRNALQILPNLLRKLSQDDNSKDDDSSTLDVLWNHGFENALDDWYSIIQRKEINVSITSRIALVEYQPGRNSKVNCYALDRALQSMGYGSKQNPGKITRILHAFPSSEMHLDTTTGQKITKWKYIYEKPGYGWVKRLATRIKVADLDPIFLDKLNCHSFFKNENNHWKAGGGGLTSLCRSVNLTDVSPYSIIKLLLELDENA